MLAIYKDLDANQLIECNMFNSNFTWGPLHAAAYGGEPKIIKTLIAHGADVELHDTWYSGTPLAWAAFAGGFSWLLCWGEIGVVGWRRQELNTT